MTITMQNLERLTLAEMKEFITARLRRKYKRKKGYPLDPGNPKGMGIAPRRPLIQAPRPRAGLTKEPERSVALQRGSRDVGGN
jgi:hypothetical protein